MFATLILVWMDFPSPAMKEDEPMHSVHCPSELVFDLSRYFQAGCLDNEAE